MNMENLHELINRYEEKLNVFYNDEHDELFKWEALKTWQEEWKKPEGSFSDFAERFKAARRDFSILIDGQIMHPCTGILKIWEDNDKEDAGAVEELFGVLLQDAGGDPAVAQEYMDDFIEGMEELRLKHFPAFFSYKMDRHSASVFMAMNDPKQHYIYKHSSASDMAKYIGFEEKIGLGQSFSLPNYYKLCDILVAALKEHPSLLEEHFQRLQPKHFRDESLHLLVFDLMYCCHTYNLYRGLTPPAPVNHAKRKKLTPEEALELEELKKREELAAMENELAELESKCEEYSELSLVGTQVISDTFGTGTIIEQGSAPWVNLFKVRFSDGKERLFQIGTNIASCPHFEENDEKPAALFTDYADAAMKVDSLRKKVQKLRASL